MTELWGLVVGAEASRGYIPYAGEDATQQAERVWPNNIGTVLGVLYSLSKEEIKRTGGILKYVYVVQNQFAENLFSTNGQLARSVPLSRVLIQMM